MTPQDRLNHLLTIVDVPTNKQVIVADIINACGIEGAGLILGTLQQAATSNPIVAAAYQALVTVGISISDPMRQGMIDGLSQAGQWPDALRDSLKALGIVKTPQWHIEGYESQPTLLSVTTELRKSELLDEATDRLQSFREALSSWDGSGEEPVL
jgi:hypothetical protein